MLKLIVGLGNPGERYQNTRHNAGKWFIKRLGAQGKVSFKSSTQFSAEIARLSFHSSDCWLLLPSTFMNVSGQSVAAFMHYYRISPSEILIAHDELDLPPGTLRLKQGGGHAGHNGLRHIIESIGNNPDFYRLRIGIGRPTPPILVHDYVLTPPIVEDRIKIEKSLDKAALILPLLLHQEWQKAMNQLHQP